MWRTANFLRKISRSSLLSANNSSRKNCLSVPPRVFHVYARSAYTASHSQIPDLSAIDCDVLFEQLNFQVSDELHVNGQAPRFTEFTPRQLCRLVWLVAHKHIPGTKAHAEAIRALITHVSGILRDESLLENNTSLSMLYEAASVNSIFLGYKKLHKNCKKRPMSFWREIQECSSDALISLEQATMRFFALYPELVWREDHPPDHYHMVIKILQNLEAAGRVSSQLMALLAEHCTISWLQQCSSRNLLRLAGACRTASSREYRTVLLKRLATVLEDRAETEKLQNSSDIPNIFSPEETIRNSPLKLFADACLGFKTCDVRCDYLYTMLAEVVTMTITCTDEGVFLRSRDYSDNVNGVCIAVDVLASVPLGTDKAKEVAEQLIVKAIQWLVTPLPSAAEGYSHVRTRKSLLDHPDTESDTLLRLASFQSLRRLVTGCLHFQSQPLAMEVEDNTYEYDRVEPFISAAQELAMRKAYPSCFAHTARMAAWLLGADHRVEHNSTICGHPSMVALLLRLKTYAQFYEARVQFRNRERLSRVDVKYIEGAANAAEACIMAIRNSPDLHQFNPELQELADLLRKIIKQYYKFMGARTNNYDNHASIESSEED